jgi:hypothetical protein
MDADKYHLGESETELIEKVQNFEAKIFESLIEDKLKWFLHDYSKPVHPVIPTNWKTLIICSENFKRDFDALNNSELANRHRELFKGQVRFALSHLEEPPSERTLFIRSEDKQWPVKEPIEKVYTHYLKEVIQL